MYQPAHFTPGGPDAPVALIREHPLAHVVWLDGGRPTADPLPLMHVPVTDTPGVLRGHVARANPLWRGAKDARVLAIFSGPQGYISPGWYPSKAEHGKVVPTWNYTVVHAHGTLRVHDDVAWLRAFLATLTDAHEATRPSPWRLDDAPADYLARMFGAVVGIEIVLDRVEAKFKLSQNRSEADRLGVQAGLTTEGPEGARPLAAKIARPD